MKKLSEKQIEDVFEIFHEQLLEPNLELIERQKTIKEYGVRFDLLFRDKNGKNLILELKRNAISRDDIGQAIQYAGIVKDSRVVLAAPIIPTSVKQAFEHYGIEYLEFDLTEINQLLEKINTENITSENSKEYDLPVNIIKEPLSKRKIIDGNVAFKVTYNDKDWKGICSANIADFNCRNRTWCKIQSIYEFNCQANEWIKEVEDYGNFPCADAGALANDDPHFYAGHFHGKKHNNEPKRVWNIKRNKIAVFTSREPGEAESERFIFFVGIISEIRENTDDNGAIFETFHCDPETALYFNKNNYPKYWNFYKNPNKPEKIGWNTGLIRYWTDKQTIGLLEWVINGKRYRRKIKEKAEYLLNAL